jgi:hypothetical protein
MGESTGLERARVFRGKQLTPEDFELQQHNFREKLKRHNRNLHGFGIVAGLKVRVNSGQIVVEPGFALDCEGNELLVGSERSQISQPTAAWRTAYVNIRFVVECADPAPMAGGEEASGVTVHSAEGFELTVAPENCNRGHRHLRARWLACGRAHALTIARLRHNSQGWRVDRGYRAPHIK